ncbi:MAG: DUF2497 domain-containing protein [Alphaproteobacteria bacterium]|nr:DUF2497 domain-containing protein [Alphaproteobacteria bacterium]
MTTRRDDEEMSMEDILASIRRYVADETSSEQIDRSHASVHQETAFRDKKLYPHMNHEPSFDTSAPEVIHLTERREPVSDPAPTYADTIDQDSRPEIKFTSDPLVSDMAQTVTSQAFSRLAEAARPQATPSFKPAPSSAGGNLTLDHLISELARPMIRQWLDNNLPGLVESLVNKEIERITRLNNSR